MIHADPRSTAAQIEVLDNGFLVHFMEAVKNTGPSGFKEVIAERVEKELHPGISVIRPEYMVGNRTFFCKDQTELNAKVAEAIAAFKQIKTFQRDGLVDRLGEYF